MKKRKKEPINWREEWELQKDAWLFNWIHQRGHVIFIIFVVLLGVASFIYGLITANDDQQPQAKARKTHHAVASAPKNDETTDSQSDTQDETSAPPLPSVGISYPQIVSMKGENNLQAPDGAVQAAGRFHYLIILSSPNISTNDVLRELAKVTTPENIQKLKAGGYHIEKQTQKWSIIQVAPYRKESDDKWVLNVVAVVDGQETWTFCRVEKGADGQWRVTQVSREPL